MHMWSPSHLMWFDTTGVGCDRINVSYDIMICHMTWCRRSKIPQSFLLYQLLLGLCLFQGCIQSPLQWLQVTGWVSPRNCLAWSIVWSYLIAIWWGMRPRVLKAGNLSNDTLRAWFVVSKQFQSPTLEISQPSHFFDSFLREFDQIKRISDSQNM